MFYAIVKGSRSIPIKSTHTIYIKKTSKYIYLNNCTKQAYYLNLGFHYRGPPNYSNLSTYIIKRSVVLFN